MTNRIRELRIHDHFLDPGEPEIWVEVVPEHETPTADVRGRLMGPRCRYATTVEVAYPFRPFPRPPEGLRGLARRVVIPEASWWEPQSPFLYEGPVELWDEGVCCDQVHLVRGLRRLSLGPRGFRVNGNVLNLRGALTARFSPEDALRRREAGFNTLVNVYLDETETPWAECDRLGLFVLCRVATAEAFHSVRRLEGHPSCLGWILGPEVLAREDVREGIKPLVQTKTGPFVGMDLTGGIPGAVAPEILVGQAHFVLRGAAISPPAAVSSLPTLIYSPEAAPTGDNGKAPADPGILGVVSGP